jgi:hypothetical protein
MRAAKRTVAVASTLVALTWAGIALADTPQAGLVFSGDTSQANGSVRFGVSPDGAAVTNFQAVMTARCTRENKPDATIEVGLTPTRRIAIVDGTFHYVGGIELYEGSTLIGSGKDGEVQGGFTAPTTASGTLRFEWRYLYSAGSARGYTCRTGTVTFQASPPSGGGGQGDERGPEGPRGAGSPHSPASGCVVPKLKGKRLKAAKRAARQASCRPGRIVRRASAKTQSGRVIAQKPAAGTRLQAGAKVKIVVSSGPLPR